MTGFHANFTITSATGSVFGFKDLAGAPAILAFCESNALFTATPVTYSATITTANGSYNDTGTATAVTAQGPVGLLSRPFTETFETSNGVVSGPGPQTKEDCKNGGYVGFGYKNQGQCIAAVNAKNHGKG